MGWYFLRSPLCRSWLLHYTSILALWKKSLRKISERLKGLLYPPASEDLFMSSWHLCRVSQQCQLAWQSKAAHLVRPRRERRRDQDTIHSSKKCSSDLISPVRTLLLNWCKLINLLILWWNWTHCHESLSCDPTFEPYSIWGHFVCGRTFHIQTPTVIHRDWDLGVHQQDVVLTILTTSA